MSTEISDMERMLNLGVEVSFKKLGKVIVRELSLEHVVRLSRELLKILASVESRKLLEGAQETSGLVFLAKVLEEPTVLDAMRIVAAATTNRNAEDFVDMGISDWLKWVAAFKKVTDWEELKELFFQLVPRETVTQFLPKRLLPES